MYHFSYLDNGEAGMFKHAVASDYGTSSTFQQLLNESSRHFTFGQHYLHPQNLCFISTE